MLAGQACGTLGRENGPEPAAGRAVEWLLTWRATFLGATDLKEVNACFAIRIIGLLKLVEKWTSFMQWFCPIKLPYASNSCRELIQISFSTTYFSYYD